MNKQVSVSGRLETALGRIASPEFEGSKAFTDVLAETARREAAAADVIERERWCEPLEGFVEAGGEEGRAHHALRELLTFW